ncbi:hypothetical protein V8C86DRAFT_2674019 [Haematococcus lacustris]
MTSKGNAGIQTLPGVGLPQNPPYTHTYRDFSSTRTSATQYKDMFNNAEPPTSTPWISEQTLSYSSPEEYAGRVAASTVVHTGGNTSMAHTSHHTFERPKFPPGTVNLGNYTLSRYLPTQDPALEELQQVCHEVLPHMDQVLQACSQYHLHCPQDGWVTTAGFVVSAHKAGLHLSRAQLLALERAVPKDTLGRINYYNIAHLVKSLAGDAAQPAPGPA